MHKYLILLFFCLPLFALAQTDTLGPQFNFFNNDRAHDYGSIAINANSEYRFQFKNSGDQPLIIKNMRASAKGLNTPPFKTIINYPQTPINPGKKGIITVTVVAQGNTGSFNSELLVTSNAAPANYPLLLITGAIVPEHSDISPTPKERTIPIEFLTPLIIANTK